MVLQNHHQRMVHNQVEAKGKRKEVEDKEVEAKEVEGKEVVAKEVEDK